MKALSIKQYWLWAITDLDKRIENRTWRPTDIHIGSRIALHASKAVDPESAIRIMEITNQAFFPDVVSTGAIIATAVIDSIITQFDITHGLTEEDKWFTGPYGWKLRNIRKLAESISYKGALGLWEIDKRTEHRIWTELEKRA